MMKREGVVLTILAIIMTSCGSTNTGGPVQPLETTDAMADVLDAGPHDMVAKDDPSLLDSITDGLPTDLSIGDSDAQVLDVDETDVDPMASCFEVPGVPYCYVKYADGCKPICQPGSSYFDHCSKYLEKTEIVGVNEGSLNLILDGWFLTNDMCSCKDNLLPGAEEPIDFETEMLIPWTGGGDCEWVGVDYSGQVRICPEHQDNIDAVEPLGTMYCCNHTPTTVSYGSSHIIVWLKIPRYEYSYVGPFYSIIDPDNIFTIDDPECYEHPVCQSVLVYPE